jgi:hypothetical protein
MDMWRVTRKDGKQITFTCQTTGKRQASMAAKVEGEDTNHLEKNDLSLPLSHEDVQKLFHVLLVDGKRLG